ncbi:MAG: hypothetical protein ABIR34_08235 [Marmoricola sp.]
METPADAAAHLRENERAAALPYTEYPPTPGWYPVAVGTWSAVFLASLLYLYGEPLFVPVLAVLVALEAGFITWYRRKRGTMPSLLMRGAPLEFRRAFRGFFAGCVVVLGVVAAASFLLPRPVAAAICLVAVTAGLSVYERVYRDASLATRARLR